MVNGSETVFEKISEGLERVAIIIREENGQLAA